MTALKRALPWLFGLALVLVAAGYAAYVFTPWPEALLIRRAFDRGGIETARALGKHVPAGVAAILDARYDVNDRDALLDVFYPGDTSAGEGLPTIVWIHGGAFLSGSKDHIAPYL
ncbi:MAG: alpha/beta hydrolase, partial [Xanthobacteraceae bacterium]